MFSVSRSRLRLLELVTVTLALAGAPFAVVTCTASTIEQGKTDATAAVATVDGTPITTEELESSLGTSLTKLEQDLYNLKKDRLEAIIGEKLLNQEASKRGVEVKQLIETEITSKVPAVSDDEVNSFYEANKARLPASATDIKGQIRQYLTNQRVQTRAQAYVAELRAKSKVDVTLPAPPVRRAQLDIEGAPVRGNATAPVTVVEFSDFHCPFCKRVQPTLQELLTKYPDKVRLVYKDLPLEQLHPQAGKAAEAGRCAREQNKFWEYHDKLFAGGPDASPETLKKLASEAGLDVSAFEGCLASGKHKAAIQADLDQGSKLGLTGTPAFFINGRPLSGAQPVEAFVQIIDEELKAQK
jgi:protein-disulfide isomerase